MSSEQVWGGFDRCGICSDIVADEQLTKGLKTETQLVDNGMVSVTIVPEESKIPMRKAHEKMEAAIGRLQSGESMELCGFCQSMGELAQAGAIIQKYATDSTYIMVITAEDHDTIEKIRQHAANAMALHP